MSFYLSAASVANLRQLWARVCAEGKGAIAVEDLVSEAKKASEALMELLCTLGEEGENEEPQTKAATIKVKADACKSPAELCRDLAGMNQDKETKAIHAEMCSSLKLLEEYCQTGVRDVEFAQEVLKSLWQDAGASLVLASDPAQWSDRSNDPGCKGWLGRLENVCPSLGLARSDLRGLF